MDLIIILLGRLTVLSYPTLVILFHYTKLAKVRKFSLIKNLVIIEKLITLDRWVDVFSTAIDQKTTAQGFC